MYLTALVAGLAVVILPNWRDPHAKDRVLPAEAAELRSAIGLASAFSAGVFMSWALWVLFAYLVPGITPGGSGMGVLLAAPAILLVTLFASRASIGTVEQRLRAAASTLRQARRTRDRIERWTIMSGGQPAKWRRPVTISILTLPFIAPFLIAASGWTPFNVAFAESVLAATVVVAAWMWWLALRQDGLLERIAIRSFAILLGIYSVASAAGLGMWGTLAAGAVLLIPPLVLFPSGVASKFSVGPPP
ncbi:hypothetical protein [Microbacterium mangrovi]|nr:hypothetical protein [Microbacterium mangrovi]